LLSKFRLPSWMEVGSGMLAVGLVAAVVIGTVGHKGRPSSKVTLSTGSAWFPSPDAGSVALIDGTTVTRVAEVSVFRPGNDIQAVQAGSSAYVLDHTTGEAVQVDGSSLTAGSPVVLGTPGDTHLSLASTGQITWAITRNGTVAQQLDPKTLVPLGPPIAFPGHAAAPVLGNDGTLWLVDGGLLRSLKNGTVRTSVELHGVTASQLVMASGDPVVIDPVEHRAIEVSPASGQPIRSACYDSTDPQALLSGSQSGTPDAFAVSPETGTLLIANLRTGACHDVILGDQANFDRYGQGVESGGDFYVPDYQAGTVIVVDTRTGTILGRPRIEPAGAPFQLLAYHGFVWFDDARADLAGIVTLQGATAVSTSRGDAKGQKVDFTHAPKPPTLLNSPPTQSAGDQTSPPNNVGSTNSALPQGNSHPVGVTSRPLSPNSPTPPPPSPPSGPAPPPPSKLAPPPPPASPPPPPASPPPTSPKLAPAFTYSPNPGVAGKAVTFTDLTPGKHTITGWTFAGGNPPTSVTPKTAVTWSAAGTYTVTLTVARSGSAASTSQQVQIAAPNDVTVPDVAGDTIAQATQALATNHLTVGTTSNQVFSFVSRGDVANTTPAANTSVPPGSAVNLNISEETGKIGTYGPAGTVLGAPARLTIDSSGNLYVADCAKNKVFKESLSGGLLTVSTVAGTGVAGNSDGTGFATGATLDCPIATAVDSSNHLYIADQASGDIRVVDLTTGNIRTLVPQFTSPWDLNFHDGTLYVVGRFSNCTIDTVDTSDGTVTPVVGTNGTCVDSSTTLSDPSSVTFDAAGDMYITEPHANIIRMYPHGGGPLTTVAGTGVSGFAGDGGPATSAELNNPDDVAFDAAGDYFITDWGNYVVREVTPDGKIRTIAGTPGTCGYSGDGGAANAAQMCIGGNGSFSGGIAVDGAGNLYVSDTNNHAIRVIYNPG
jgi:sugar lactone lactonase YvrE